MFTIPTNITYIFKAVGTLMNVTYPSQFSDPDTTDSATFSLLPSTYSSYFTVNPSTGALTLSQSLDFETMTATMPIGTHTFTMS